MTVADYIDARLREMVARRERMMLTAGSSVKAVVGRRACPRVEPGSTPPVAFTRLAALCEADPRFREGMARAAEDFENGRTVPLSEVIRGRRRPVRGADGVYIWRAS